MNKDASGKDASAAEADKLYEERGPKTIIRLMTVGAYMCSVSFVAVALSGYYIFFWEPPNSRLIHAHAAHLRADSDIDFMAADSLTVIQVDKSNESTNFFNDMETNNRYKYISSSIENATEDQRFMQGDKELTRENELENSQKLTSQKNTTINKLNEKIIKSNEETIDVVQKNKEIANQTTDFYKNNNTKMYEMEVKPNNSVSQLNEDISKNSKKMTYSDSEDIKIIKKFFKIL